MTQIVVCFPVMLVQPAVFVLTTLPTYVSLNDSYSVCGQHPGIDAQYPLSQWTCSKPAKIIDNAVTITMNIYQHYNFTWKWINQAYDISDGRADEFGGEYERIVNTGTVCVEGVMVKYETKWGVKRANLTGDCVNAPWVPVTTSVVPVVTQPLNSADPSRALTQSSADLTPALKQFSSQAQRLKTGL